MIALCDETARIGLIRIRDRALMVSGLRNLTFLHLYSSSFQLSTISSTSQSQLSLRHSRFQRCLDPVFRHHSLTCSIHVFSCSFSSFLSAVLYAHSEFLTDRIARATVFPNATSILNVSHCRFSRCKNSDSSGGGLSIGALELQLIITDALFDNCYSASRGGGFCAYSLASLEIDSSGFTQCGSVTSGQSFYADLNSRSHEHCVNWSVFFSNGHLAAPMASDTFTTLHGIQSLWWNNVSRNQGIAGGSGAFFISPSSSCQMYGMNIINNSCDIGRTLYLRSGHDGSTILNSNILMNGGGDLGVVMISGHNCTFNTVAFADNERHSIWFLGQDSAQVFLINCNVNLTETEFRSRAKNVDLIHSSVVYGAKSTIKVEGVALNETLFAGLIPLNESMKRPAKVDVFNAMRAGDVVRERDVTLLNETVVCLLFPIFIMICFTWLRTLYLPRVEKGALLLPAKGNDRESNTKTEV
jgi:hypothetical protein